MPKGVTQYVKTSGGYVAYQEFGDTQQDILFITNWNSNLEVMWEEPSLERSLDRLSTFGRVICFDKRGTGSESPIPLAIVVPGSRKTSILLQCPQRKTYRKYGNA